MESSTYGNLWAKYIREESGDTGRFSLPWKRLDDLIGGLRAGQILLVGGSGNTGKTWLLLRMAFHLHRLGVKWTFCPLEDSKEIIMRRMLALMAGTYSPLDRDQSGASDRLSLLERHKADFMAIEAHLEENPRLAYDVDGVTEVPLFGPDEILWWADGVTQRYQVAFLDPISAADISSAGRDSLQVEERLCRRLLGLVAKRNCAVVISLHLKNRPGQHGQRPATLDDLAGSSAWQRLCQSAIIVEAFEDREFEIFRPGGGREAVTCNRTVFIGRTREGVGARTRLAFTQQRTRPELIEHGVICPPKSRRAE